MVLYKVETSITASSGAVSVNTLKAIGGICRQVLVYSASTDTTFNLTLIDEKSRPVRDWTDVTYQINDLSPFPVQGIYTISIAGSTADEEFTVFMGIQES